MKKVFLNMNLFSYVYSDYLRLFVKILVEMNAGIMEWGWDVT